MRRETLLILCAIAAAVALAACERSATTDTTFSDRLARADEVFRDRKYEEAGEIYESIAGDADAAGDASAYVEACAMRARSYLIRGEAEEGRPWIEKARERAVPTDPLGWSRYLGVRGRFEWEDGDNETATRTFREMFDYCERNELWDRAVDAAHMVAITGNPDEKFEWAQKGIAMAEKGGMTGWLGPLWNNLGWDYVDAGRYEEALDALKKAREYHSMSDRDLPKLIADYSVAHVTRLVGALDDAEDGMRDVLERAQKLRSEGNPDALEWIGFSRWDLGEIALKRGDRAAGISSMREALSELEEAGMPKWDPDDWREKQERLAEIER
jgi:tetratricopeptide (TPR) repeat protein